MADCCIIGGGVIGLSLARELAGRGAAVEVVCRDPVERTASWAAAGIFPPVADGPAATALERFTAFSDRLHWQWADELRAETGIDNGLRRCGGLHVAGTTAGRERLAAARARWLAARVRCIDCDGAAVAVAEPALAGAVARGTVSAGVILPDEAQIRPSRHLDALLASCRARGVRITTATVRGLELDGRRVGGVRTDGGTVRAERYCLAAGSWSEGLAAALGLALSTRPIRGQIVLVRLPRPLLSRIVSFGLDYLVPRPDGRLLVGATIEDVGFDDRTTAAGEAGLIDVARRLLGDVDGAVVERSWSGLRPGNRDGRPTLGPVPGWDNVWVTTGHFRAGMHLSTGSAVAVADMLDGAVPAQLLDAFAPWRDTECDDESVDAYLARVEAAAVSPP
jgi:glycine oxidase